MGVLGHVLRLERVFMVIPLEDRGIRNNNKYFCSFCCYYHHQFLRTEQKGESAGLKFAFGIRLRQYSYAKSVKH